ncbi:MAG: N-acetyl-gamma-glutamyl-phosphate reductase [Synergistaceae bacterium]
MLNVAIIGATGYSGQELIRILLAHPMVRLKYLASRSYVGESIKDIYRNFSDYDFSGAEICVEEDIEHFSKECDVIFLALPHGIASEKVTLSVLNRCKVIDLGADFRLNDVATYEEWYKVKHHGETLLSKAVYGLPELFREKIKGSNLIANPGCYATCSILSLAPFVKGNVIDNASIIIDAKSGTSGAGRSAVTSNLFCEVNENFKAYKIASHRHTPEIEQVLELQGPIIFTPHLLPINRGILTTIYAKLKDKNMTQENLKQMAKDFYKDDRFVRIIDGTESAEIRWVKASNFFDMNIFKDNRTNRIVITSALDNLVKGAAGQAVQNMNLLFGYKEDTGLTNLGVFPS